ncbi:MAG: DoxX family protein [Pseudomonadota bacterium]
MGRFGLASLFLLGGLNKLMNFASTQSRMIEVGLEPTVVLLPMTIGLELIGGGLLAAGVRPWVSRAAMVLCVFTLATNAFFHRFWELDGPLANLELSLFFKNIAISGALLFVAAMYAAENRRAH